AGVFVMADICLQERNDEDAFPISPAQASLLTFEARQNLTGASLPQIRRGLARAWRLVLSSRVDEALTAIEGIELQLDDLSFSAAEPFRAATQLLRAGSLAFRDDSLAALAIALPHLNENGTNQDYHAASTLCRLGFWHVGNFGPLSFTTKASASLALVEVWSGV